MRVLLQETVRSTEQRVRKGRVESDAESEEADAEGHEYRGGAPQSVGLAVCHSASSSPGLGTTRSLN